MITIDFDTHALMDSISKFADDIQNDAIRSAAYAASKVIYSEMKLRAPVGPTGNLKASIYQYHNGKDLVKGKHIYSIGPNKKTGKGNHWHLIEYGHWQTNVIVKLPNGKFMATKEKLDTPIWRPAKPFIRPTYDAKISAAMAAAVARLHEKVRELSNA